MVSLKFETMMERLKGWFPEREFLMRSQGQVRFLKLGTRVQMAAAGLVTSAALGWAVSIGVMAVAQHQASAERDQLLHREARIARSEDRLASYRGDIAQIARELEQRQNVLEELTSTLPDELLTQGAGAGSGAGRAAEGAAAPTASESEKLIGMVREALPEAEGLARLEARQLAFTRKLTSYADRRADRAEQAMRELGLDPRAALRANEGAMGGPLELLGAGSAEAIDPRFEQLALSIARMNALERGLDAIPQVTPADMRSVSSGFGYRRDPFTRRAAMHSGLDFAAPQGSPIRAAAAGRVSYAGWKPGYGKVVEISHASGMITRYAHMSRWTTRAGAQVAAGAVIGAIGSTGRSTGPHLHFEVRINDRAVDPRPFLEKARHVLEEARADFVPASGGKAHAHAG